MPWPGRLLTRPRGPSLALGVGPGASAPEVLGLRWRFDNLDEPTGLLLESLTNLGGVAKKNSRLSFTRLTRRSAHPWCSCFLAVLAGLTAAHGECSESLLR